MADSRQQKKRHHFIPETYLKHFANAEGGVHVYRKDDPRNPVPLPLDAVGVKRYYYSQPTLEGERDNNTLEDFFNDTVERKWDGLVKCMLARSTMSEGQIRDVAWFVALQWARVPATRDAHESLRAGSVRAALNKLAADGKLPPAPEGAPDILSRLEVSIDPHTSLRNIPAAIRVVESVFDRVTIRVVHNVSGISLLTSDNPVVWLDPGVPDSRMRPYALRRGGPAVFLFPVTPRLILYGDSHSDDFGWNHVTLDSRAIVKRFNQWICRFGYESVFGCDRSHDALVPKHADKSPIMTVMESPMADGSVAATSCWEFGQRRRKPKWSGC